MAESAIGPKIVFSDISINYNPSFTGDVNEDLFFFVFQERGPLNAARDDSILCKDDSILC